MTKMKTIADMREANENFLERNVRKILMNSKILDIVVDGATTTSQVKKLNPTKEKFQELRESGRAGERESGRAGERESGRAGERESRFPTGSRGSS